MVRAGLVPALRRGEDGGRVWDVRNVRPLIRRRALVALPPEPGADDFDCIALSLTPRPATRRRRRYLADVVERILERSGSDRVLLVIDQARHPRRGGTARTRFIDLFLEATNRAPLTVVLTLRGDFHPARSNIALATGSIVA